MEGLCSGSLSCVKYLGLIWLLFLTGQLCLSGIWQGLWFTMDTKRRVTMRLDNCAQNTLTIMCSIGNTVLEGLCDHLAPKEPHHSLRNSM